MSPLRLFTAFHGNLDFSALPDRDLPLVIERCYWPLLVLAQEARLPLGIELPARTLARIESLDPEWLKTLRELAGRGLVEPLASGWSQIAAPLVPLDVNRANLELGRRAYAELLGAAPRTWFVNEQTWSAGLAALYAEVGAEALVMEWNNPASARPELRPLRLRPARLQVPGGEPLPLLWNDCVIFQKLQRVAHGVCPEEEFSGALRRAAEAPGAAQLCAYGGDLEIFDYRPGRPAPPGAARGLEMTRLAACLRALRADPRFAFRLPREVRRGLPPGPVVELSGAADPIPCKKQPRYNPSRWAVSGRDGFGMNTECFRLRRALRAEHALASGAAGGAARERESDARALVELWGSDFRTRATEERLRDFHARLGAARARTEAGLAARMPKLPEDSDVLLVNAAARPWEAEPVEVPLRLPPGRLRGARIAAEPAAALDPDAGQLEVESRYRDGSVRDATLVLEPRLAPGERLALRLLPAPERGCGEEATGAGGEPRGGAPAADARLASGAVDARFLLHRGGALAELRFPGLADRGLVGTLPHGSFESIAYTPDFYSGHVVALTESQEKVTDLVPVRSARALHPGPVRSSLEFQVETPLGAWTKRYRAYRRRPRLDLIQTLVFHESRLHFLRLGTVTVLPGAFERASLGYATVNGGPAPERFPLGPGCEVAQQRPAAPGVTASSCLGATEGWVSLGDAELGVAVMADRARAAVAPLLEFAEVDGRPFLRLHHSAAEADETRATFFRGVVRAGFCIVGHAGDLDAVRRSAGALGRGLLYRTEQGVGIAGGL